MEGTCSGKRILIIDDEVDTGNTLAILLRLHGCLVEVARTGPEGLQVALATRPEIIILDIGLPGMDGHEVAARLRPPGGLDEVVIIAYTGYASKSDRARSMEAGIDYHLAKPVPFREILTLVNDRHLRGSWALSRLRSLAGRKSPV